mmetsp:Transcript_62649/g.191649  ORF Transcript_62649/g.191649 Transcript_62649/m.191649 type:complete len:222 (-) Transcript_62649:535-1200(-)
MYRLATWVRLSRPARVASPRFQRTSSSSSDRRPPKPLRLTSDGLESTCTVEFPRLTKPPNASRVANPSLRVMSNVASVSSDRPSSPAREVNSGLPSNERPRIGPERPASADTLRRRRFHARAMAFTGGLSMPSSSTASQSRLRPSERSPCKPSSDSKRSLPTIWMAGPSQFHLSMEVMPSKPCNDLSALSPVIVTPDRSGPLMPLKPASDSTLPHSVSSML